MVLYEDTRQQIGKHENIRKYCEKQGIEIIRQALNVGDYQIAGKGDISVDTKYGVPELASNVFQDHERFRDECLRAQRCGIQLFVLVEENLPGGRLDNWRSPIGWDGLPVHKFRPDVLRKAIITMQEEYGVKFRFCDPMHTGMWLIRILTGVGK
jgi:ribosome-associated protein